MNTETIRSNSVSETQEAGFALAKKLTKNGEKFFIALEGDLGAGKTAFTRGVAAHISPGSRVKSPSYTIVNEYRMGDCPLFHFDLYRLGEDAELSDIGFSDYAYEGCCILEWSEYLKSSDRPDNTVTVRITKDSENSRTIEIIYPEEKT